MAYADWDRFHRVYATRVRSLKFDDRVSIRGFKDVPIAQKSIHAAAIIHQFSVSFLPNLRTLDWSLSRNSMSLSILPFVPRGLTALRLEIKGTMEEEEIACVLRCLVGRTPELHTLTISTSMPITPFQSTIASWLSSVPALKKLVLPRLSLTSEVVRAAGSLSELKSLNTDWDYGLALDGQGVDFMFSDGAFPVLEEVEFECRVDSTANLIQASNRFSQLKTILISSRNLYSSSELQRLLVNLASTCAQIEDVTLVLASETTVPSPPITFATIAKLFPCKKLKSLGLVHNSAVTLHDEEIEQMGDAWEELEHLTICMDPHPDCVPDGSGTPISSLPKFALSFPKLESLALYLRKEEAPKYDGDLDPDTQFRALKELDVGTSHIPGGKPAPIAFFLASLLPPDATISHGRCTWSSGEGDEDTSAWDEVEELRKLVSRSKAAFQTKTRIQVPDDLRRIFADFHGNLLTANQQLLPATREALAESWKQLRVGVGLSGWTTIKRG